MAKAEATVEERVGMMERGELRLPEMQRADQETSDSRACATSTSYPGRAL